MDSDLKARRLRYARHCIENGQQARKLFAQGMTEAEILMTQALPAWDGGLPLPVDTEALLNEVTLAETVADRIKTIRKHYSLTQSELADLLEVKQASVSRWEAGDFTPAEKENYDRLGDLADLPGIFIERGYLEPHGDGSYSPEKPVRIVGTVGPLGRIEPLGLNENLNVPRPREGRPHKDVVGLRLGDNGHFGIFQNWQWVFFYRENVRQTENTSGEQELCVIKTIDYMFLGVLLPDKTPDGLHMIVTTSGAVTWDKIEWFSPILSIRQSGTDILSPIDDI